MSNEEIKQRAEWFIQSIKAGRMTANSASRTIRGWLDAGRLTEDQWHALVGLVANGI
jgi:hypothetical protein